MAKKKHGKKRKSELLQYQLRYVIDRQKYGTKDKALQAAARARKHFLKTGDEIDGVRIVARWRNPNNKTAEHANWKSTEDPGQSLSDFYKTMHGGRGALQRSLFDPPNAYVVPIVAEERIVRRRHVRKSVMRDYWIAVKAIQAKHPKWPTARARAKYRGESWG